MNSNNLICRHTHVLMLYSHLPYHNDSIIVKTDARRKIDAWRIKMHEGRHRETSLEKYSPLFLLQGFACERCWRPNINFIFWPHCYDRHVVSLLFSWCWGLLPRGFPRAPSVGFGFHYHIWSLLGWVEGSKYYIETGLRTHRISKLIREHNPY